MSEEASGSLQREGAEALSLMQQALALLDKCRAHIAAAKLDLAVCQLEGDIAREIEQAAPPARQECPKTNH